jgi:uncharacterized protein with PIN domain
MSTGEDQPLNLPAVEQQYLVDPTFFVDTQLGPLARRLRMYGFDAEFVEEQFYDEELLLEALQSDPHRILVTNRRSILRKNSFRALGARIIFTSSTNIELFLSNHGIVPNPSKFFTRCCDCNGLLQKVEDKESVRELVYPQTFASYDNFYTCEDCGKVFWEGALYQLAQQNVRTTNST